MVGPDTVIINLQNGVDNEEKLAAVYGAERVMGGAAYIFTSIGGPGLIRQIGGPRRLVFGEMSGGASERGDEILAELKEAEINAEYSTDIEAELWTKFIFICAVGGMTALTRSTIGEVMAYEGTRKMMRETMREVYLVGRARSVKPSRGRGRRPLPLYRRAKPGQQGQPLPRPRSGQAYRGRRAVRNSFAHRSRSRCQDAV